MWSYDELYHIVVIHQRMMCLGMLDMSFSMLIAVFEGSLIINALQLLNQYPRPASYLYHGFHGNN